MKINKKKLNDIWDLLVKECRAIEKERDVFVSYFLGDPSIYEYRFCGIFGLGGKIHQNSGGIYISYYREHEKVSLDKILKEVNVKIDQILTSNETILVDKAWLESTLLNFQQYYLTYYNKDIKYKRSEHHIGMEGGEYYYVDWYSHPTEPHVKCVPANPGTYTYDK